jgi:NAD(P)-dependent dehydrogenase (short-subunit alcohol dehydrogenase family)
MFKKRFNDKIVLIIGASSGIGEITAYEFAKEGATLILTARREDKGLEVLKKCLTSGAGNNSLFIKSDVSNLTDITKIFNIIDEKFGYLDCAFNNAGTEEIPMPIETKTEEIYDKIMNTDVKGIFFAMQQEIKYMRKKGKGSIVNTASISGLIGQIGIPIYNGAKHAILGMTKSLGIELAKEGIRVNAVSPGAIKTELYDRYVAGHPERVESFTKSHPIGRIGTSEEISGAVLFLCSDEASIIVGQNIVIDGGYTAW